MPPLFQHGSFKLHSGSTSNFLVNCEALTNEDLEALAMLALQKLPPFRAVHGIPNGGLRFAEAMRKHLSTKGPILIVDDVLTTGASMQKARDEMLLLDPAAGTVGLVIFARGVIPSWITALWRSH